MKKSHGKVREFQNFPKKMLVNRLLEILVSIICKQYLKRNVSKHKLQAIYVQKHSISNIYGLDFSLKIKSASSNICAKSSNSRWMKMAKIGLPKGSGKRLKVREKSVKSQGILKWILSGNPVFMLTLFSTYNLSLSKFTFRYNSEMFTIQR